MTESITKVIVQGTLLLLVFASVLTWAFVFIKGRQSWTTRAQDRKLLREVGAPLKLASLRALKGYAGPAWRLLQAALSALTAAETQTTAGETSREAVERALTSQIARERQRSEAGLAVLASIGTTAPFVGLFGTVFGIIHALRSIGSSGSASLEVVAGPIGEALVATGIGIAVAVPAVLSYNFFVRRMKVQLAELEQFGLAFIGAVAQGGRSVELRVERGGAASAEARREATA